MMSRSSTNKVPDGETGTRKGKKKHFTPEGAKDCVAKDEMACPYGGGVGTHVDAEQGDELFAQRCEEASRIPTYEKAKRIRYHLDPVQARSRLVAIDQRMAVIAERSDRQITCEDANPVRARRRLMETAASTTWENKPVLSNMTAQSVVLPSGAFRDENGERTNTDRGVRADFILDDVAAERQARLEELAEAIRGKDVSNTTFTFSDESGRYTYKIKDGQLDRKALKKLPERVQRQIKSPKESVSVELAAKKLPPEVYAQIVKPQEAVYFVYDKAPNVGANNISRERHVVHGENVAECVESCHGSMSRFYRSVAKSYGNLAVARHEKKRTGEAIKAASATKHGDPPHPVFAPARSQRNGAVVTHRNVIDKEKMKQVLTPSQIQSIMTTRWEPDPEKGKAVLSPEKYEQVFNARTVSLSYTQSKDVTLDPFAVRR